jgi:hypothetical protein
MRFLKFLLPVLLIASCTKPGPGGKAQLNVHVIHESDGRVVPFATVYIKYGASESPGNSTGLYDAQQTADNSGKTVFEGLRRGSYYLYAVGIDTGGGVTTGGITFDIRNKIGERDLVIETTP